jgi:hypothetical protein
MWDCEQCGCRAIAQGVTRCPQCGEEHEMPKTTVDNGPSNRWEDGERGSESHAEPSVAAPGRTKPPKAASGQRGSAQEAKQDTAKPANGGGGGPEAA